MASGPAEYTAGQQELPVRLTSLAEMVPFPLDLAPWLWAGLLRHRIDRGSTVVLLGLHDQETSFDVNAIIRSQVALLGSYAYSEDDVRPLNSGPDAFAELVERPGVATKVVLVPREGEQRRLLLASRLFSVSNPVYFG